MMSTETDEKVVSADMKRTPLIEHMLELRKRLTVAAIAACVAICLSYFYAREIYDFLVRPLAAAMPEGESRRLIYTGLAEAFMTHMRIAIYAGIVLAFPVIAWQAYAFVAPGLYKHERRIFMPFLAGCPLLFAAGMALAYYYVIPMAWRFFISFETAAEAGSMPIQLEARVGEYLNLMLKMLMAFGLAFQLPMVLVLLAKMGMVTPQMLAEKRKYAVIIIFIVAGILTPPDVMSQIALALPLMLLYEVAIVLTKVMAKNA